ncbi:D-alanyl-D-alanine carboxypeptidase/D-alanyl-D-alanine endopeptidase [Saccharothrix violaceirubra]|uniref:D-alanyl-D-alanine carboxypeptidase/D-alanyl-D-alanine-endopeptidase (Penicillin-binding protein 4) n=1 Tax=Saccharothrix violaceirubra TaxID=413306 RepID=A0A7W7T968_9PSEU|nr:D-alanyl-D-alanine carboxypeptidase/D-alanyl-D-alanine-endopeptidase [Saccharothrix violaceirubra]MBB4968893.1 D-alanyl-D-alanine carboxypeptidase/D-alanyl-D-alanine-endopeptidase (penicillin-binding protein 4) [Saccharothrix violaceirubra]
MSGSDQARPDQNRADQARADRNQPGPAGPDRSRFEVARAQSPADAKDTERITVPTGAQAESPAEAPAERAMPRRIEPRAEDHAVAVTPKKKGRKRKVLGVVAAVVVLGAGTAFAGVGLDWFAGPPTPTTAAPAPPADIAFALRGVGTDAPAPSAAGVAAVVSGPAASAALAPLSGRVVDPASGTTLWEQGQGSAYTPASTIKILTSAAALLSLDHTAQFSTKVVRGAEPGTVVLVGGGDPTLTALPAGQRSMYPGAPTIDDLVAQVRKTGPVTKVLYDTSRYTGDGFAPGWDPADVAAGYVTPISPLIMDGGRTDPKAVDPPRHAAPAETVAQTFAQRLGVTAVATGPAPANAEVLGEVKSQPVDRLVENLMQVSDNVLAETMAREVAIATGAEPSFAGAAQAVVKVLTDNGFDLTGGTVVDGSGLSPNDKIPARLLADVLVAAASPNPTAPKTAKLRPLLTALPVAGGSGTLAGRYGESIGKGWLRAKTGTLTGVNSLAGVVVDKDGRLLVFAFMSLSTLPNADVRQALDVLAASLRSCGCS